MLAIRTGKASCWSMKCLQHSKVSQTKLKQTKRLLLNDLTPAAVRLALQQLKQNSEFAPSSQSALARSRADWLYGINLTRAYTLHGQRQGYQGVLSSRARANSGVWV